MASKYRGDNDNLKSHILTLRAVIIVLTVICLMLWISAENARKIQRVHIPPDLRNGATVQINKVPDTTAYAFALNIFQYLNTWLNDGAVDYPKRANELAAYLTPKYLAWIKHDIDERMGSGELSGRTRTIIPINGKAFETRRVDVLDDNTFVVWLDMQINEYHAGIPVKKVRIRYPIRVVKANINFSLNPWGLQLDGFQQDPTKLKEADLK